MYFKCNKQDNYLKEISNFLKIVSEENRLKILCFLDNEEKCVCDIVDFLWIPQNLTSHHLKKLKDNEIIKLKKEWLKNFYSLNKKITKENKEIFNNLIK